MRVPKHPHSLFNQLMNSQTSKATAANSLHILLLSSNTTSSRTATGHQIPGTLPKDIHLNNSRTDRRHILRTTKDIRRMPKVLIHHNRRLTDSIRRQCMVIQMPIRRTLKLPILRSRRSRRSLTALHRRHMAHRLPMLDPLQYLPRATILEWYRKQT